MKRILFIVLSLTTAITLTACGSDKTENEEKENTDIETQGEPEEVETQSEGTDIDVESVEGTSDPMEAGNKNNGNDVFLDGAQEYKLLNYYVTDVTDEDGFTHIDFEGYEFMFSLALAEDINGDNVIMMFGESENNTDETVQFNADMEIVADSQDQTETQQGFGNTAPGIKTKNYDIMYLEYGEPDSFTLTLYPPMVDLGDGEYDREYFGEPIELEFNKE